MIRVFGKTDTDFSSNGDIVLKPLKAKVHKEDNGDYYLNIETDLSYIDYLQEDRVIVANTPTGDQAFRVGNVTKTKSRLSAKCMHVFYDSMNYLIADSYVVNKDCNGALYHLNMATEPVTEFTTSSDVTHVDSFRCVRQSLYEAVQTVLERWGGHLVRDNFNIGISQDIGHDNGIVIQYKKNIKEITCEENWDNVVTKLLPVGKDGILLNGVNPSASIYVTSETQYPVPYTKTVSFEQDIEEEDYSSTDAYKQALVDDLRRQAQAYVDENCLPQINYTLKANMEKVTDVGDVVEVIDDRLGINMMTNVIAFEYDCLFEQYTEIEFGSFSNSLSGLVGNITTSIDKTVSGQITEATSAVNNQIGEKVTSPAKQGYVVGEYVVYNDTFCRVSAPISRGDLFQIGVNLSASTVGDELETIQSSILSKLYPVGSIYISTNATSPASLFGGVWEQIKDRFLLASGDTYDNGSTGGEASHTLTEAEMPSHTHGVQTSPDGSTWTDATLGVDGSTSGAYFTGGASADTTKQVKIKSTGGGQAHNNMPPYLAVTVWQRIS